MALRLQELHPSLVHFPIALMPAAVGLDLIGSRSLMNAARALMPVAAGSAVVTAAAGLIAHWLVALGLVMCAVRAGSREPGWG